MGDIPGSCVCWMYSATEKWVMCQISLPLKNCLAISPVGIETCCFVLFGGLDDLTPSLTGKKQDRLIIFNHCRPAGRLTSLELAACSLFLIV